MTVIIGIDPHKATHTAVAISCNEQELAEIKVRATGQQTAQLLAWAEPLGPRTWAVESAGGLATAVPATGGGGRTCPRCAGHAGLEGAGARHRPLQQERSERCPVGGRRRPRSLGLRSVVPAGPWRGPSSAGQAEPRDREAAQRSSCPGCTPRCSTSHQAEFPRSSSATPAMSVGSPVETSTPPMPVWLPSSCPRGAGSSIASVDEATASSTMPSTWWPSVRSARPTRRVGSTSSGGWPRARPSGRPSGPSSVTSATPSIGSSSSTHRSRGPGGQAGTTHSQRDRLCILMAGSSAKSLPDPSNFRHSRRPQAARLARA